MVLPIPRAANSTKRQVSIEDLVDGVVDDERARLGLSFNPFLVRAALVTKVVDAERSLKRLDDLKSIIKTFEGDQWNNRPKDLILHQRTVETWILDKSWL